MIKSSIEKTNSKIESIPDFSFKVSCIEKELLDLRKRIEESKNEWTISAGIDKNYFNKEIAQLKDRLIEDSLRNKSFIEEKFSHLPDFSEFVNHSSFEKLSQNIESLMLDSKNAILKASNVDIQNQIHSKKIENLQLQLRNNEIKNG